MLNYQCQLAQPLKRATFLFFFSQTRQWSGGVKCKEKHLFGSKNKDNWVTNFSSLLFGPLNRKTSVFKTLKHQLSSWMSTWGCQIYTWAQGAGGVRNTAWTCYNLGDELQPKQWRKQICSMSGEDSFVLPTTWNCHVLVAGWGSRSNTAVSRGRRELSFSVN